MKDWNFEATVYGPQGPTYVVIKAPNEEAARSLFVNPGLVRPRQYGMAEDGHVLRAAAQGDPAAQRLAQRAGL